MLPRMCLGSPKEDSRMYVHVICFKVMYLACSANSRMVSESGVEILFFNYSGLLVW